MQRLGSGLYYKYQSKFGVGGLFLVVVGIVLIFVVIHCLIYRKEDTFSATNIMLCWATGNQVPRKQCTVTIQ
jgi:hypothetical protein